MTRQNEASAAAEAPKAWQTPTVAVGMPAKDTTGGGVAGSPDVVLTTTTVGS